MIVAALQLRRLHAVPGAARLHAHAWRGVVAQRRLPRALLEVREDVADGLGLVVALAYPLAYYLALSGTRRKYVLLLLLIAPFLTSYLLRVLAWKVILGDQGVINSFLFWSAAARTSIRSRSSSTAASR